MAIVVNDMDNLPKMMLVTELKQFTDIGISEKFLTEITEHPIAGCGVKRKKQYIIDTDSIIRHSVRDKQYNLFVKLLELALGKGFSFIVINY